MYRDMRPRYTANVQHTQVLWLPFSVPSSLMMCSVADDLAVLRHRGVAEPVKSGRDVAVLLFDSHASFAEPTVWCAVMRDCQ